jgi:hypothetical protein
MSRSKQGTAATKYCEQLVGTMEPYTQEVQNHMQISNFNPYGLRKGAATYDVSGTTATPSIPSVARRGGGPLDPSWMSIGILDPWETTTWGVHWLGWISMILPLLHFNVDMDDVWWDY